MLSILKQRDKFFDLTTNEEYDKSAINFTYARLFKEKSASQFIMHSARRIVVEDWCMIQRVMILNKD